MKAAKDFENIVNWTAEVIAALVDNNYDTETVLENVRDGLVRTLGATPLQAANIVRLALHKLGCTEYSDEALKIIIDRAI